MRESKRSKRFPRGAIFRVLIFASLVASTTLSCSDDPAPPSVDTSVGCVHLNLCDKSSLSFAFEEPFALVHAPFPWTERFEGSQLEDWNTSRGRQDIYAIANFTIAGMHLATDEQRENIVTFLRQKRVFIDTMTMTLNGVDGDRWDDDMRPIEAVPQWIGYLDGLGVTVEGILHQSTISEPHEDYPNYPLAERVADSTHFANYVRNELAGRGLPPVGHALIDATDEHDGTDAAKERLQAWADGMRAEGHATIAIIHDFPASHVTGHENASVNVYDLGDIIQFTIEELQMEAFWWASGGPYAAQDDVKGHNIILSATDLLLGLPRVRSNLSGILFGDFVESFSAASPDAQDGAPYTALETFNALFERSALWFSYDYVERENETGRWISSVNGGRVTGSHSWLDGDKYQPISGDFNNDGMADIGLRDTNTGTWHFAHGDGAGVYGDETTFQWAIGTSFSPIVGDFDHDGRTDIGLWNRASGRWHFAFSNGDGHYANTRNFDWLSGSHFQPIVGDFDSDGLTDIGLRDTGTGIWRFAIFNGVDHYHNSRNFSWHSGTDYRPLVGDHDCDGDMDIGLHDRTTGVMHLAYFNGDENYDNSLDYPGRSIRSGATAVIPMTTNCR